MGTNVVGLINIFIIGLISIITTSASAEDTSFLDQVKNSLKANKTQAVLIFTAPPRNRKKDDETYRPIVEFLAQTLNRKIEYRVPTGWGDYNKAMINDSADIVFDGPHFNAWRMNNLGHKIIVRLPEQQVWKIIVAAENNYKSIDELAGRKVCLQGATNFGKLNFMSYFPNVMRLPEVKEITSRQEGYNSVIKGACTATIVTEAELDKYNLHYGKENLTTKPPVRVLHTLKPTPNQAFSVSAKLPKELQIKIQQALLSEEGQQAMAVLRNRYARKEMLIAAKEADYKAISEILNESYPFYNPFNKPIQEAYGVGGGRKHTIEAEKDKEEFTQIVKENKN